MKRIHIVGVTFAAIFAFSMIGVSGASAALWDQCTKTASPLEFENSDCTVKGTNNTFGWEEIVSKTAVDSLTTLIEMSSGGVTLDCEGSQEGTVGPGNEGEVTKLLNLKEEEVTEAKPTTCTKTAGSNLECEAPVTASAVHLPCVN